ncbi:MAG: prephenate dehydratase [Cystobacterineae bacterium]|nr:prephenate dehydratase [Cystobacterineae bacterium]
MANHEEELARLRGIIDGVDEEILRLVSLRARHAQAIGEVKKSAGQLSFWNPEREAEVLQKVEAQNPGPLPGKFLRRWYLELMSACLALEKPLRVAYLGPEGTYTHVAMLKYFGASVKPLPEVSIGEVFRKTECGEADFGVVPVENSTEGMISHTLDMFLSSPLSICGETLLRINHHLLSRETAFENIARVYSHPQPQAQCRHWLEQHLPHAERVAASSNAEAVRVAAKEAKAAAIAGKHAAELYGMPILASHLEDEPNNTTRFWVLGTQRRKPTGQDKTSVLASSLDQPGTLMRLLEPLARHGISMTKIESRPSKRGLWNYVFFLDVEGHMEDAVVAEAFEEMKKASILFKVLGSYPRAQL